MSIEKSFMSEIERQKKAVEDLVSKLVEGIKLLPDNEDIVRVEKGFVISSSMLGDSWDPAYYDFRAQYQAIITAIEGKNLSQVQKVIESILNTGVLKVTHSYNYYKYAYTWRFRPEVLGYLENVYRGEKG